MIYASMEKIGTCKECVHLDDKGMKCNKYDMPIIKDFYCAKFERE